MKCTRFKSLRNTKPLVVCDLVEVLNEIQSDKYKSRIEKVRSDEIPSKSKSKDWLPVFTPTGIFTHRSIKGLESYNGIICLDIDGVEDVKSLKEKASNINYVYSAFVTPSGKGLKVIIKTNATKENYRDFELIVSNDFESKTGAIRDKHCKDIARIQFVSYDPDIYINENSEVYSITENAI